ncbi:MAG TPA: alpha-amylase family glycosyl hydrolase [Arachnia sp.]|nr:alpha-amylase family glycosyl hydrolase [Arachnia sp.]
MSEIPPETARIEELTSFLYGSRGAEVAEALIHIADRYCADRSRRTRRRWTGRDAILITYADSIREEGVAPVRTLDAVLAALAPEITGVHLLPFFPWTSDDGFSVSDFGAVDPAVGTWDDIAALGSRTELMVDAVINHVSVSSAWFQGFLAGDPDFAEWFISVPPETDLSKVVRPRTLPLLTEFETARGPESIWTTFSADQVDLNYASPEVLLAVVEVLLDYAARGATLIRLDAVGFLWKEFGTACIHHPKTHAIIQLIRTIFDVVDPAVSLITETNVPHGENISYFGDGSNEAQLVYNFALPPLVLHSFVSGSANELTRWASGLATPSSDTTFFNFLASHDGIGLRGVEDILSPADIDALAARARAHDGLVAYRSAAGAQPKPYELNINYFDALSHPDGRDPVEAQVARFVTAHAILLSLPGVPGIYVHSLLGSRGWPEGVRRSGADRSINRERLERSELEQELADETGRRARVLSAIRRLLRARAGHAAFDPHAASAVLDLGHPGLFAIERSADGRVVRCVHNVSAESVSVPGGPWTDLLTDEVFVGVLQAWESRWLIPVSQ